MRSMIRPGAALWLACAAWAGACAPVPPPAGGPGSVPESTGAAGQPPAGTGREFGVTHHALLNGTVVCAAGRGMDSVTVAVQHPVDPGQGSMRQTTAATGADGGFTLPAQMFVGGERDTASVRVGVVVRAFGLAARDRGPGGAVATDSATVWVTMVPLARAPAAAAVRLALPVPCR